MENTEKIQSGDATKELFRSSAQWMRAYAIIMIIFTSIMALVLLVLSVDGKGMVLKALSEGSNNELAQLLIDTMGVILFGMTCFVVILGYAAIKLLGAANKFTALSYSSTSENLIAAFRNLKNYWMYYGIMLIVIIVLGAYFMIRVYTVIKEAQG